MTDLITRIALPRDIVGIYRLIESVYIENLEGLELGEIDQENIIIGLQETINKNMALVIEKENQIIASIGMKIEPSLLSKQCFCADQWIICSSKHRSMRIFKLLLKFAVHISILNGVKLIMNISSTVDTERKIKLYESLGFKQIGGTFLYDRK